MSLWGKKTSGIKPAPPKIRVERVAVAQKPPPIPSKLAASRLPQVKKTQESPARSANSSARSSPGTPDENGAKRLQPAKRKALRQKSPTQPQLQSDSEDDDSCTDFEDTSYKRQRLDRPVDTKRKLRSRQEGGAFEMIHAADISSPESKTKAAEGAGIGEEHVTVELQYPSSSQRERYALIFGKEQINPTEEIIEIANHVTDVYLTNEQAKGFKEPNMGIIRRLTKAKNLLSRNILSKDLLDGFKDAVDGYNSEITELLKTGALARNLDSLHHLPLDLIECILRQVYDRAVSPKVDILKKRRETAEIEKDNTYGELLPMFVSKALVQAGLKSDQVFVDLGSGVGNVVLQAALEFGCESFGCEMMENACELAEAQQKEFAARCRLWGLRAGKVELERGNFFESSAVHSAIKRADVIVVNNEVFSSDTNGNLVSLFLDCKDGCKIISLQPFVEPGHEITDRNLYDPRNQLEVEQHEYHRGYVSWKDAGGSYFISTKDRKRVEAFEQQA